MTVEDAYLEVRDGASVLNRGTIELRGDSELEGYGFGDGFDAVVHNVGVLRKTGASAIDARVPVDNDGTVEVQAGSLELYELVNWTGIGYLGETGIAGGEYVVRGTLVVPGRDDRQRGAARARRRRVEGRAPHRRRRCRPTRSPALERNAGGGELVLRGGRSLARSGALANQGVLDLGPGSTVERRGLPPDRRRRPAPGGHGGRRRPRRGLGTRPARRADRHARRRPRSPATTSCSRRPR